MQVHREYANVQENIYEFFDSRKVNRIMEVTEEESIDRSRQLAQEEGIVAGMSSGGATAAAV